MKKRFSAFCAALVVGVLTVVSTLGTFSADDKLMINGNIPAEKGDKVTYNIYISGVPEKVEDLQLEIKYSSDLMKVIEDSIKYPDGGSSVYNADLKDQILFNSANGIKGWDFKEKTLLFGASFTVEGGGETDLTYFIQCMDYLSNSMPVDTYILTCDYLVNDKPVKKNLVPVVDKNGQGGNFTNFENGKGQNNGGDKPAGALYGGDGNANNNNNNNNNDNNNDNNNNNANVGEGGNIGEAVTNNNGEVLGVQGQTATNSNGEIVDANGNVLETTESTVIRTNSWGEEITTPDGEKATYTNSSEMWRNIGIVALALAIVGCIVVKVMIDKRKAKKEDNLSE